MKRLLVLAAAALVLLLAAPSAQAQLCASTDCGPYAAALHWNIAPWGHTTTGYFVYLNGTQEADVSSSPWVLGGMDCGSAFVLGVRAHDGTGDTSGLYTSTYTTPTCGGSTGVGAAAEPAPTCTVTTGSMSTALGDLNTVASGSTVCLSNGTYSQINLSASISPHGPVVLAAANPGGVTVAGIQPDLNNGSLSMTNVTFEGFILTNNVFLDSAASNVTFQYMTMSGFGSPHGGSYFDIFNNAHGNNVVQNGISMLYNQLDNGGQCLEGDSTGSPSNWTFSHNVCGPGMGLNTTSSGQDFHFIQAEGITNFTVDNNAFLGPNNASFTGAGSHPNLVHWCGTTLQFKNNIDWLAQNEGTLQIGDDCPTNGVDVENNLFYEGNTSGSPAFTMQLADCVPSACASRVALQNGTVKNNTDVASVAGNYGMISNPGPTTNLTDQNNIIVNFPTSGDYGLSCSGTCVSSGELSDDGSGSTGLTGWTPAWESGSSSTSAEAAKWTPHNGAPWSAPPSGLFTPHVSGSVVSTLGYQGTIGP